MTKETKLKISLAYLCPELLNIYGDYGNILTIKNRCEWRNIDDLPELAMDHQLIYTNALTILRQQLSYKPIGLNLLPERFTLSELQKLYETILGKPLNRGNFYRRIMRFDILVKHEDLRKGGAHKAPYLYSFDPLKYYESLQGLDW